MTSNGYSPLTVRGLDPGRRYSVTIGVFDGNNQEVLSYGRVKIIITVINITPSKINDCISKQLCLAIRSLNVHKDSCYSYVYQPNTKL